MSTLKVTNIKHASSSTNNLELLSNGKINLPNNSLIIQVVSTQKTGAMTFPNIAQGANTGVISGFTRSITVASSSNNIDGFFKIARAIAMRCFCPPLI